MSDVREFGAVGDGIAKDTAAIQKALDAGGVVFFPPGVYLTGTIYLRSNGGLELAPGAVLLGSPDRADYNADDFDRRNCVFRQERVSGAHLIIGVDLENVVIRGGEINGNCQAFYQIPEDCRNRHLIPIGWRPGQMIYLCQCRHVTLSDARFCNSTYWTCFLHGCEYVSAHHLQIQNKRKTLQGDGLDIDSCRFVTVSDCVIDVGDDCITLRSYNAPLGGEHPCEFICITNCILRTSCNGIRIGVGDGTIREAVISNTIIRDTNTGICICSKYSSARGTAIRNIQFSNLNIDAVKPILIVTNAWGEKDGPAIHRTGPVSFNHIRGKGLIGCVIRGMEPGDLREISFNDVVLDYTGGKNVVAEGDFCENPSISAPGAFYAENVKGLYFTSCAIRWQDELETWQGDLVVKSCEEVHTELCRFAKGIRTV